MTRLLGTQTGTMTVVRYPTEPVDARSFPPSPSRAYAPYADSTTLRGITGTVGSSFLAILGGVAGGYGLAILARRQGWI